MASLQQAGAKHEAAQQQLQQQLEQLNSQLMDKASVRVCSHCKSSESSFGCLAMLKYARQLSQLHGNRQQHNSSVMTILKMVVSAASSCNHQAIITLSIKLTIK